MPCSAGEGEEEIHVGSVEAVNRKTGMVQCSVHAMSGAGRRRSWSMYGGETSWYKASEVFKQPCTCSGWVWV